MEEMLCFLNPGHDRQYDSGAVNPVTGIRECDLAYELSELVGKCLEA
jgi:N-acetylmuramoyl-L-alanine amidase